MKPLVILGAGGTCRDILDAVLDLNDAGSSAAYECLGFLDDDPSTHGMEIMGRKVLGTLASARQYRDAWFINGIGSPADFWRKPEIIGRARVPADRWATIVHPTASVSRTATIGAGTAVLQHVTIGTNVRIGRHVVILPGAVVSHDARVADCTCIAGGACLSGLVTIEESCYVGSHASVRERIHVGRHALVGMGSVVVDDVPARTVVAGVPARAVRATY